jgi:hypothetical protein
MNLLDGFHNHHIIPRYKGGGDDSNNLVLLHPIDHAIWHLVRFRIFKNPADGWAYNRIVVGLKDDLIPCRKGIPKPYMRKPKSEETKRKMAIAATGRKLDAATIEKMRQANLGKKLSPESKEKLLSYAKLAYTPEANAKRAASLKGNPVHLWAHKIAEKNRGRKASEKEKQIISARFKGRKQSPEQIAKRVAARKATLAAQGRTN